MRGYRGFFSELSRTGSGRALWLQVRTGAVHVLRQIGGRSSEADPVEQFLAHYGEDGIRPAEPEARALSLAAQACLACGLCSAECGRVGGAPALDPRDAVLSASRLETEWRRLGIDPTGGPGGCEGCDACARVCPAGIPIDRVQGRLRDLV